jgi:hypothetical protein
MLSSGAPGRSRPAPAGTPGCMIVESPQGPLEVTAVFKQDGE